jgi:hypothetical protein
VTDVVQALAGLRRYVRVAAVGAAVGAVLLEAGVRCRDRVAKNGSKATD